MRYPRFLNDHGRIGYIAPSFGATSEPYRTRFQYTLTHFSELGYQNILGPNCGLDQGIGKSNTAQACAEEINDFFLHDRSDVIISCGGGETMCEDLSYVDFEGISKAKPKWFMGFSDNTNLTFTLPTLCDTAAIYGPCAGSLAMRPPHPSLVDAYEMLCGKTLEVSNYDGWERQSAENAGPLDAYHITEPFHMRTYGCEETMITGRLLGGCLDVLSVLCGTKYDRVADFNQKYERDGVIWFLEACDLNPMSVRRSLWQLKNADWFRTAKGFLIGRPQQYDALDFGCSQQDAVISALGDLGLPILMDVDIGHLPPTMPLISGAMADVCFQSNQLSVKMRLE